MTTRRRSKQRATGWALNSANKYPVTTPENRTRYERGVHSSRGHRTLVSNFLTQRSTHDAGTMRQIHGRLARLARATTPGSLPHEDRSRSAPRENASSRESKPQATTGSVARAASEFQQAQRHNPNITAALRSLVAQCGSQCTQDLTTAQVQKAANDWKKHGQHTRSTYSKCLRRFLRWLEELHAAPPTINRAIARIPPPSLRAVIATDEERTALLRAADPALQFFLALCSDLGLRHRTAMRITISNYDRALRCLSFTTKGNTHQTLPVTEQIAEQIEQLIGARADRNTPIVKLLHTGRALGQQPRMLKRWWKLKEQLGIREELRIHDLRRTMAEDVWQATHDLRQVQAQLGHRSIATTAKYLASKLQLEELRPVLSAVATLRAQRSKGHGK